MRGCFISEKYTQDLPLAGQSGPLSALCCLVWTRLLAVANRLFHLDLTFLSAREAQHNSPEGCADATIGNGPKVSLSSPQTVSKSQRWRENMCHRLTFINSRENKTHQRFFHFSFFFCSISFYELFWHIFSLFI